MLASSLSPSQAFPLSQHGHIHPSVWEQLVSQSKVPTFYIWMIRGQHSYVPRFNQGGGMSESSESYLYDKSNLGPPLRVTFPQAKHDPRKGVLSIGKLRHRDGQGQLFKLHVYWLYPSYSGSDQRTEGLRPLFQRAWLPWLMSAYMCAPPSLVDTPRLLYMLSDPQLMATPSSSPHSFIAYKTGSQSHVFCAPVSCGDGPQCWNTRLPACPLLSA